MLQGRIRRSAADKQEKYSSLVKSTVHKKTPFKTPC